MLIVPEPKQKLGIGSMLMDAWEDDMQRQSYKMVLTSSLSDESAQHFYRKRGYKDIGSFALPGKSDELFFMKEL